MERDGRSTMASKKNRKNWERTVKDDSWRHSVCRPSGHHPCCTTSSFNHCKHMHSPSPRAAKKRKRRRLRQKDLFHFFPSPPPSPPEGGTDVTDPHIHPPGPSSSSARHASPSATIKSLIGKSRRVRDSDPASNLVSISDVRKNKSTRKLKPLQPNRRHNCQVSTALLFTHNGFSY